MYTALSVKDQPFSIRYPKASSVEFQELDQIELLPIGSWDVEQKGEDALVLAVGPMTYTSLEATKKTILKITKLRLLIVVLLNLWILIIY